MVEERKESLRPRALLTAEMDGAGSAVICNSGLAGWAVVFCISIQIHMRHACRDTQSWRSELSYESGRGLRARLPVGGTNLQCWR